MTHDEAIDPLDFASALDDSFVESGQQQGRQYGYQRGFRHGFSRGLDYAWENHREIAVIAAACEDLHKKLSDSRQIRLVNGVIESCREFRTLAPDVPRYAELLTSIRARHAHLTGSSAQQANDKPNLTF